MAVQAAASLSANAEGHVDRVGGAVYYVKSSRLLEPLGSERGIRSRIDPFCFVVSRWQIQDELFLVLPRRDGIRSTTAAFAVMNVERVLLAVLAKPAVVRLPIESAHHKAFVRHHVDETETLDESLQTAQGAQELRVLRRVSRRILCREEAVQLIEAGA